MQDPENLTVYRRSIAYAVRCTRLTRRLRAREAPGMASQLARASCSVPANIAEGVGQPSSAVCAKHLGIAIGSLNECDTHLRILSELSSSIGDVSYLLEESKHLRRMLLALRAHYLDQGKSGPSTPSPSTPSPLDP